MLHFKDYAYHHPKNALQQFGFESARKVPRYKTYTFTMGRDRQPVDSDWSKHPKYVPLVSLWVDRKLYLVGDPEGTL